MTVSNGTQGSNSCADQGHDSEGHLSRFQVGGQPGKASARAQAKERLSSIVDAVRRSGGHLLFLLAIASGALLGCGGGYPGGAGIVSTSASAIALDAGQSIAVSAVLSGTLPLTWSLSGASCTANACGSLSSSTGSPVTFTAPTTTSPLQVSLLATVPGTQSSKTVAITVNPDPSIAGVPPAGTVGMAYSTTLSASGGTAPLKLSLAGGSLPAGLTFNAATGVISGTPTAAGTVSFVVQAVDASAVPFTVSATKTITIGAPGAALVVMGNPPAGVVGSPYATTLQASGGTAPYAWSVVSGSLPPGLALAAASGNLSGTPTMSGNFTFTVQAQDAAGTKASASFTVAISAAGSALTVSGSLPNGTVNMPYTAPVNVSGGTPPYLCSTTGSLPAGLTLGANCIVSGTPGAPSQTTFPITTTDAGNPAQSTTTPVNLTINPAALSLTNGTLPNGTVNTPYSSTIGVSGGTAPYACTIVSGALPVGLSLGANCLVSGTPTVAGPATVMVQATDASNPQLSKTGPETLTINPAALSLTTGTLPNGTVNTPYSSPIGVSGGTAPYTCTTSSTLPAGLVLNANCIVSGTPTMAGSTTLAVTATDSASPAQSTPGQVGLTINPAPLSLATGTLPNGTVGTPYSSTIAVMGGTSPYACTVVSGALPAGLTLGANCLVSGTPTVAGTANVIVQATDASNPQLSKTGPESITISAAASTLTVTAPPSGTVNTPYAGSVGVTGGTGPYTCTLASGTTPPGLTLNADCTVTGTPTTAGTTPATVAVSDASSPQRSTTGSATITINPATSTLTLGNPPTATVSTPYTGAIGVSGGTAPYACTLQSGALPAGLSLTSGTCSLTGTPTTAGSYPVVITATDSASPADTFTGPVTVTVQPIPALTFTGSLPDGTVGQAYTQTLAASGGVGPYTYAVTAGAPPAGLTLSAGGVLSGTPTAPGASSFTITATDSEGTPQTASLPLILLITYPPTATDGELNGPYAFLFQGYDDVVAGVLAYQTATVGSFTADGAGAVTAGELDTNHQNVNPAGDAAGTKNLLGTYTLGTDSRGSLTLSTLNSDGTVATTHTYAIAVKAPVAPATATAQGRLIEFDGDQVAGTKGSGTFLAQTASAFTAGLNGSYAFGVEGDTPCLPACTAGLVAGPAAAVGQFATDGAGAIVTGAGDETLASINLANATLGGSYGPADGNGRLALSLTTSNAPAGVYPTNYAVYTVNANQAFLMSTDPHSAYILLAGSASLQQTPGTFNTAASLTGPFVGYENSPTNPGLAGVALENVLNLSTATLFQGTVAAAGTCRINYVDQGGTTGLANGLTGLGSGTPTLNALLGTYAQTGDGSCSVAANGRAVVNYPAPAGLLPGVLALLGLPDVPPPARVAYLSSPNTGYFLETGYAGLGRLEQQTGLPSTLATLNGTYVYGTTPASSLASLNGSGVLTADGVGNATITADENVGIGTINVLQLGLTSTLTYTLDDGTAGRFLLGANTVIYAISPSRFVLLDKSALTTSPAVTLLY